MRFRNPATGAVVNVRDGKRMGRGWEPVTAGSQPSNEPPPKTGRGSGKQAWSDYAAAIGVQVDDGMTRDDIIAAVEEG